MTNDQLIGGAGTSPVTADVVKKLTERMERLEARLEGERERTGDGRRPNRNNDRPLTCWKCAEVLATLPVIAEHSGSVRKTTVLRWREPAYRRL